MRCRPHALSEFPQRQPRAGLAASQRTLASFCTCGRREIEMSKERWKCLRFFVMLHTGVKYLRHRCDLGISSVHHHTASRRGVYRARDARRDISNNDITQEKKKKKRKKNEEEEGGRRKRKKKE